MKTLADVIRYVEWRMRVARNRRTKNRDEGIRSELAFWDGRMAGLRHYLDRLDPRLPLTDYLSAFVDKTPGDSCSMIDVGAGPLTNVGKRHARKAISLVATDVLGDEYREILRKHGINPPVPTIGCKGEELSSRFKPDTFDIAISQNALDHAEEPMVVLKQMLTITKPGGYVLLVHREKEATREGWTGMHKWDFSVDAGNFRMRGISSDINVSSELRAHADINAYVRDGEVYVEIHKRTEPAD